MPARVQDSPKSDSRGERASEAARSSSGGAGEREGARGARGARGGGEGKGDRCIAPPIIFRKGKNERCVKTGKKSEGARAHTHVREGEKGGKREQRGRGKIAAGPESGGEVDGREDRRGIPERKKVMVVLGARGRTAHRETVHRLTPLRHVIYVNLIENLHNYGETN